MLGASVLLFSYFSRIFWTVLCCAVWLPVNLTLTRVTWEGHPQLENASIRFVYRQLCGAFSWMMIDVRGSRPLWEVPFPAQVALHGIEEQIDWFIVSKINKQRFSLASASGLDFRSLPWLPALNFLTNRLWLRTCKPNKHLPPKVGFDRCFITAIENKLRHGCWTLGLLSVKHMF